METADYLWYLKTAARHFWAGNLPQQLQWYEYEPQPGEFKESRKAVEDLVEWAESQRWGGFSASLFDGGHAAKEHWSNKLACKDLERHLHQRLMRDMHQFSGKIQHYEVWRGALEWRDWIDRCGEELFLNAFKWAAQADARGVLCSSEGNVLNTLTLTNAEAYHNLVYGMRDKGVPLGAVCVQARFDGEVDASTVKHRLDVLKELELPIFVTDVSVAGLDPAVARVRDREVHPRRLLARGGGRDLPRRSVGPQEPAGGERALRRLEAAEAGGGAFGGAVGRGVAHVGDAADGRVGRPRL